MNPPDLRIPNRIVSRLVRIGVPMGPMAIITVRGRRSGEPRSAPIALSPIDDGWRLVAAYGVVDWVKNLRSAGVATITRRGRTFSVTSLELPAERAAPVLRESVAEAGPLTRRMISPYFSCDVEDPLVDWEEETRRHPVFVLTESG